MYACVARNLLLCCTVLWRACGILGTAYSDFLCGTTLPDLHLGYVEKFLACSCHIYKYFKYYFIFQILFYKARKYGGFEIDSVQHHHSCNTLFDNNLLIPPLFIANFQVAIL